MGFDRRLLTLFVLLAVIGLPAFTLRVMCVGHACDEPVEAPAGMPFCSLPAGVRSAIAAGFREDRSPEVLGVTSSVTVGGGDAFGRKEPQPRWPSIREISRRVPLVIAGADLRPESLPSGIELDQVAPTTAALMGIQRPHPEVRSGEPLGSVTATEPVPLVVQVVWKAVGSAELEEDPASWPRLRTLSREGPSTLEAEVPSLPLDPAATLTTIGTGGLPSQHGITGTLVRNNEGRVVEAWSERAPVSVIAALGDDLDDLTAGRARVGLVATHDTDRGLIGRDWYVDRDRDDVVLADGSNEALRSVTEMLASGYGRDDVVDLLGITLSGSVSEMDRATGEIATAVEAAVPEAALVVTATGSSVTVADLRGKEVGRQVESLLSVDQDLVQATAPGGLFLDQDVIADEGISEDEILAALKRVTDTSSAQAFADVFPAIAVSFGRYC